MNKALDFWRPRERADLGAPLWAVAKTVAIFIISQVLALLLVVSFLSLVNQPQQNVQSLLDSSISGQFFYVLIAEALAVGLVLAALNHRRLPWSFIGLGRKPVWTDLWWAVGGIAGFYVLLVVAGVLIHIFWPGLDTNQKQNLGFNNITGTGQNVLTFLALVVLPPLGEEPLVRGYLFGGLRARWHFWPAAVLTSLLFGIAHLEFGSHPLLWAAAIDTFLLSIVLVALREKTNALYAGVLVHMLNNLIAFGVYFH